MKRMYIQPDVQVAQIEMDSCILTGSPVAPEGPSMGITSTSTSDQW